MYPFTTSLAASRPFRPIIPICSRAGGQGAYLDSFEIDHFFATCSLQVRACLLALGQSFPPQSRSLIWNPIPQLTEQGSQSPQASSSHGWSLHGWNSKDCPRQSAVGHVLFRRLRPPPQWAEQPAHSSHGDQHPSCGYCIERTAAHLPSCRYSSPPPHSRTRDKSSSFFEFPRRRQHRRGSTRPTVIHRVREKAGNCVALLLALGICSVRGGRSILFSSVEPHHCRRRHCTPTRESILPID